MTEGLSSTSFCRIATALRYSASASAGLPPFNSRMPWLKWLSARPLAEFGVGGVVVDQLLPDRHRLAVLGLRLRRLARLRQQVGERVVTPRQVAADSSDGGVVVGQLLRIATALRYSASASAGLPVLDSRTPRWKWLSARSKRNSVTAG